MPRVSMGEQDAPSPTTRSPAGSPRSLWSPDSTDQRRPEGLDRGTDTCSSGAKRVSRSPPSSGSRDSAAPYQAPSSVSSLVSARSALLPLHASSQTFASDTGRTSAVLASQTWASRRPPPTFGSTRGRHGSPSVPPNVPDP